MKIVKLPIELLLTPDWNPNQMTSKMMAHLSQSLKQFGLVVPLVARMINEELYQVIGGAQRLTVLKEPGWTEVPCIVVAADDIDARLLSQSLNHIAGRDDPVLRSELLRELLVSRDQTEILALIPETAETLSELALLTEQDLADQFSAWQQRQEVRLRHLTAQFSQAQLSTVQSAIAHAKALLHDSAPPDPANPNETGNAIHLICREFLEAHDMPIERAIEEGLK